MASVTSLIGRSAVSMMCMAKAWYSRRMAGWQLSAWVSQ
jgi:hypothetical protein